MKDMRLDSLQIEDAHWWVNNFAGCISNDQGRISAVVDHDNLPKDVTEFIPSCIFRQRQCNFIKYNATAWLIVGGNNQTANPDDHFR